MEGELAVTDPETNAYHEAGHAFLAFYVGARVRSVTIEPDRDDGPERYADIRVEWPPDRFAGRVLFEKQVLVALAGPVAEMHYSGDPYHPGFVAEWAADWRLAWQAAAHVVAAERDRLAYLESVTRELHRMFDNSDHWARIAAIADNLLAHETLEADDLEELLGPWMR